MINSIIPWRRTGKRLAVRNESVDTISALQNEMNRMFDNFFDNSFGLAPLKRLMNSEGMFSPVVDVSENKNDIKVLVDVPGVDEKDIQVSLNHNVLEIHGEKKYEKEDKEENYHYFERSYGSFHRSIPLPCEVDGDNVDAVYQKGVLTITLPKTEDTQGKRITVKAK